MLKRTVQTLNSKAVKYLESVFHEKFEETKDYNAKAQDAFDFFRTDFVTDYGHGKLFYHWVLYVSEIPDQEAIVVAEKSHFSDDDLKELKKFCKCSHCSAFFLTPFFLKPCPCCVGCVSAGNEYFRRGEVNAAIENRDRKKIGKL